VSGEKPRGLFRGSEFARLLILLAILIVGWPLVIFYGIVQKHSKPDEPQPVAEADLPPPVERIELSGVQDDTQPNPRDNAGYRLLFDWTRNTPGAELAAKCRRDVVFSQIFERPSRFRGMAIHLDGTLRRVSLQDQISKEIVPSGRFYEAWCFTQDSQRFPYVLAFENAPPNLPTGGNVSARVSFDGFFFKKIRYRDGANTIRLAPLLIGRVSYAPPAPTASTWEFFASSPRWYLWPAGLILMYVTFRVAGVLRRARSPHAVRDAIRSRRKDDIDPDTLAEWVESEGQGEGPNDFDRIK
jgi:hypothetical protein